MALAVENLCLFRHRPDGTKTPLVEDLSFTLSRGRTVALCGPSGCGKTSVALSLINLLPPGLAIGSGRITLDGEPFQESWRGQRIGYVFQEPGRAFHPLFTVERQMAERLKLAGTAAADIRSESITWLERIGLPDPESRLNDRADQFSGGELQRIMIAMTLARKPEYLVADEITSSLDVLVQGRILSLVSSLQEEFNFGCLLITHDQRVASALTDDTIELEPISSPGADR